jgi:hypothetical protein
LFSCQKVLHKVLGQADLLHDAEDVEIVFKPVFGLFKFGAKFIILTNFEQLKHFKENFKVVLASLLVIVHECLSAAKNCEN